ncbi:dihydrofolate reductase family protein [Phytoactinopolyspora mesophila]|uniref:Dihydrofolate reductase n=1 Tax=Phytoactinopolyspora mesophila TaxID=2650750 RepID=A0A7K3LWW9_9ACTN|nr:dihydrofolate reductase family protein [Phytoactinopolyspora mesophila]NDL55519.1 dihydrofolate reductase [Phytoactinopolyspora mesophila]
MAVGKVVAHATMSLDGFIAAPGDDMEWIFEYLGVEDDVIAEFMNATGAMLGGRRSYDVGARDDRDAYEGAWHGRGFVLTHEPPERPPSAAITFLSGDVRAAVAQALAAAGGKNLEVVGANVVKQCLEAGVVDEIFVHVLPVLLGDGVRFFERRQFRRSNLELIGTHASGQVTNLRFRVVS